MQLYLCLVNLNNYALFILVSLAIYCLSPPPPFELLSIYLSLVACAELVWAENLTSLCESSAGTVLEATSLKFTAPHSSSAAAVPALKESLRLWNVL